MLSLNIYKLTQQTCIIFIKSIGNILMFRGFTKSLYLCSKNITGKQFICAKTILAPFSSEKKDLTEKEIQQRPEMESIPDGPQELQQKIQEQMLQRLNQLEGLHKKTQELIDTKIKFPVKLCGTKDQYEKRYSYLPERIMGYYRLSYSQVTTYLLNMYKASLYSIADRNTKYMDEYWEEGLKEAILPCLDKAKQQNYKIRVEEDHSYLEDIEESCQILDAVMMRGLSMDRKENKNPDHYLKYSEADDVGLITFTPKYITHDNEHFIDPTKNKKVYEGYENMLLRVLVRIKTPFKLNIKQFSVPNDIYTWEHICLFENQMVAPKHLESRYKLQTLMEWLGKYRFGQWKLVDIDNFMLGNSPFRNHYPPQEQIDPIFKGTKLDKSFYVDIRKI